MNLNDPSNQILKLETKGNEAIQKITIANRVSQDTQSNLSRMLLMVGTMPSDVCTAKVPEMKSFCTSMTKSAFVVGDIDTESCGNVAYLKRR